MDHKPLSIESDDDAMSDFESNFFLAKKQVTKTRFRLLLAGVALGTLGLAGISHSGLPVAGTASQPRFPASRYLTLMQKFSKRVLQAAEHDFTADFSLVYTEDGKPDPDAMSATLALKASKDESAKDPDNINVIVNLKAQAGKGADLKTALQNIWEASVPEQVRKGHDAPKISTTVTGDVVVLDIKLNLEPKDDQEEKAETALGAAMDSDKFPKCETTLTLGRTLDQMSESADDNILSALGGVKISQSVGIATQMIIGGLEMVAAEAPPQNTGMIQMAMPILGSLAKITSDTKIFYKTGAHDNLRLPTLAQMFGPMISKLNSPHNPNSAQLKKGLKGLQDSADGVDKVVMTDIPSVPLDFEMTFKNFKPLKLLGTFLDEAK